jgi:hypothetical protein
MTNNYLALVRKKRKWGYDRARSKFAMLKIGPMLLDPPKRWLGRQSRETFARTDLFDNKEGDHMEVDPMQELGGGVYNDININWEAEDRGD